MKRHNKAIEDLTTAKEKFYEQARDQTSRQGASVEINLIKTLRSHPEWLSDFKVGNGHFASI